MSNSTHKFELLKKLAREVSFNYEINWTDWKDDVAKELHERNTDMREMNEQLLLLMEKLEVIDDTEEYGRITEDLLTCYIFDALLERKKKIEQILI
jgi:hypothetical protein